MKNSSLHGIHGIGSACLVTLALLAAFVLGASGEVFASELRFTTPIGFTPFTEELPIPPVVQPVAAFEPRCSLQVTGLNPPKFYGPYARSCDPDHPRREHNHIGIRRAVSGAHFSGNFLIDSESRMRLASARPGGAQEKGAACNTDVTQSGREQGHHSHSGHHSGVSTSRDLSK